MSRLSWRGWVVCALVGGGLAAATIHYQGQGTRPVWLTAAIWVLAAGVLVGRLVLPVALVAYVVEQYLERWVARPVAIVVGVVLFAAILTALALIPGSPKR